MAIVGMMIWVSVFVFIVVYENLKYQEAIVRKNNQSVLIRDGRVVAGESYGLYLNDEVSKIAEKYEVGEYVCVTRHMFYMDKVSPDLKAANFVLSVHADRNGVYRSRCAKVFDNTVVAESSSEISEDEYRAAKERLLKWIQSPVLPRAHPGVTMYCIGVGSNIDGIELRYMDINPIDYDLNEFIMYLASISEFDLGMMIHGEYIELMMEEEVDFIGGVPASD